VDEDFIPTNKGDVSHKNIRTFTRINKNLLQVGVVADLKRSGSYVDEGWRQLIVITLRQILQSLREATSQSGYLYKKEGSFKKVSLENLKSSGKILHVECDDVSQE